MQITRHTLLLPVLALLTAVTGACGAAEAVKPLKLPDRIAPDGASGSLAGQAITEFGGELLQAVVAETEPGENVVVSPASVAIALAMLEPGASGDAQTRLRSALRIDDPVAYHRSMNSLEQDLESRVAPQTDNTAEARGDLTVSVANAAYLQRGYPFEQAYLDAVGTTYGLTLHAVDFRNDPDAVGRDINTVVATATNGRIPHVVADGTISPETVLALVNALYLNASWRDTFPDAGAADDTFTLLDGDTVQVPLMDGFGTASAKGDGWVAATKPYIGDLAADFILPDEGRFEEVAANLAAAVEDLHGGAKTIGGELAVPRFETRFNTDLGGPLAALGLGALSQPGGLLGIANDRDLTLGAALHETFLAMDEEGTEAAAATVMMLAGSAAPEEQPEPVAVILDRPFLLRIYDERSGASLFIGQILNPTK